MKLNSTQRLVAVNFEAEPVHVPSEALAPWLDAEYTVTHTRYDSRGEWADPLATTRVDLPAVEDVA